MKVSYKIFQILTEDERPAIHHSTPGKNPKDEVLSCKPIEYLIESNASDIDDEDTSIASNSSIELIEKFAQFLSIHNNTPHSAKRKHRSTHKDYKTRTRSKYYVDIIFPILAMSS